MLLIALLLIPLFTAVGVVLCHKHPNIREAVTLAGGIALFFISFQLSLQHNPEEALSWTLATPFPGYPLLFTPEPLGLLFSLLVAFLWPVTSLYAIGYMRAHEEQHQTRFYCFFALSIAVTQAIAMSGNMLTLFLFYELLTLATFPLVTHAGTESARQSGRAYLGILMATSIMFLLLALLWSAQIATTLTFSKDGIYPPDTPRWLLNLLLFLFVFGTAKTALMPFHRWLPAAMVAPVPVSALLHAVAVVKAGVFTLLKVVIYLFGIDLVSHLSAADLLAYLAGFTLVVSSLIALRLDNIKARLAYSTIGQLSYIVLGTLLVSEHSLTGATLHILTHAFGKITLFFCAGAILLASHKSRVSELNGLGAQMPITLTLFTLAALSIIGLPPFAGLWSKWWLLLGTLETGHQVLTAALLLSSLLNLIYLLEIPIRAFFYPAPQPLTFKEAPTSCLSAASVTTLFCLLLFIFPEPLLLMIRAVQAGGMP